MVTRRIIRLKRVAVSQITLILDAAEFAAHKHRDQRRKATNRRPYVGHVIEVAHLIADVGQVEDAEILAAALLHDTLEDTATTPDELREKFGATVEQLVAEVSDDDSLDSQVRKELQITNAPKLSPGAKLIRIADKTSNVREIGLDPPAGWDVARRARYFAWARRVVAAMGPVNPELERLFLTTVEEAERLLAAGSATAG